MPKVLLVEDDLTIQMANKLLLSELGCQVVVADTGMLGIERVKSGEEYDIYFVDLGLPDILGYEVLSGIRQEKGEDIPVIAITGYTGDAQKEKCLEAGATEVLHKPVLVDGFKEVLKRYKVI
jgi:CheY-like chemotaxis protein